MTKILSFTLSFLLVIICNKSNAQETSTQPKFVEINFGTATSTTITKQAMDNSPSGDHSVVTNQVFGQKTSRIKAKKGTEFGVEYKLLGKQADTAAIEIEWVFPKEITDPKKKVSYKNLRYPINLPFNFINASTYALDNDFEVVKGTWLLNIYYADKMIYTHKFELY